MERESNDRASETQRASCLSLVFLDTAWLLFEGYAGLTLIGELRRMKGGEPNPFPLFLLEAAWRAQLFGLLTHLTCWEGKLPGLSLNTLTVISGSSLLYMV